jgi:uncharacterized membrane protein (DUF485 family)
MAEANRWFETHDSRGRMRKSAIFTELNSSFRRLITRMSSEMRVILFFFFAMLLTPAFATPPTPEDAALFQQCANGYLANLKSFTVVDIRSRFAAVRADRFEELSQGDFSSVIWTEEFRQYDHLDRQRCELNFPESEKGVVIFTPVGVLQSFDTAFFTTAPDIIREKVDLPLIDAQFVGYRKLSQILSEGLSGSLEWSRVSNENPNPTFSIDADQIVEFDPSRGFLAVRYRVEYVNESGEKEWREARTCEAKQLTGNRWFPTKTVTKISSQECQVSEILDIQIDKPYQSSDFDLTLSAGCEFSIENDDITLTHPLTIGLEDFPRLPQLALKYKFNQLLFNNPLDLPKFLYDKPQALWLLAPYLLILALLILALITFRLYRGRSTGNA